MSEIARASIPQQLQMLREQTRLTGGLHEAQVLQLKLWPLILFQQAISSSFTWDPDKRVVKFEVVFPRGRKKEPKLAWWKERVTQLNEWVQVLLGDEWMVQVVAGRKTFNGSRKVTSDVGHRAPDAGAKGSAAH